jgi:hypothetical protein
VQRVLTSVGALLTFLGKKGPSCDLRGVEAVEEQEGPRCSLRRIGS